MQTFWKMPRTSSLPAVVGFHLVKYHSAFFRSRPSPQADLQMYQNHAEPGSCMIVFFIHQKNELPEATPIRDRAILFCPVRSKQQQPQKLKPLGVISRNFQNENR